MADNEPKTSQARVSINEIPKTQSNYNLEIRCSGHTWVVHRANLCTKSKIFKALCDGALQEGVNAVAEMHDEDPERIERMLLAISTPHYPVAPAKYRPEEDIIEDARLYAIADRYDIPTLRSASADAFKVLLDDVATRGSRMLFIEDLLPVLYETTPASDRVLRKTFEAFVGKAKSRLLPRGDIQDFAKQNEEFGAFIMKAMFQHWEKVGEHWCSKCGCYGGTSLQGKNIRVCTLHKHPIVK